MKKTKRLISLLLAVLFMFAATQSAFALIVEEGTCGRSVTWTLDSTGTLTIKGSGMMAINGSSGKDYYTHAAKIKTVKVTQDVISVRAQAFQRMASLKSATLESCVQMLNQEAFSSCTSLTSVVLSEGLTTIGNKVFEGCKALQEITLPSTTQSLGTGLFLNCNALKTITVRSKTVVFPKKLFAPTSTVIRGYAGSTAEAYAKTYGLQFVALEDSAPTQPTSVPATQPQTPTTTGNACPLCGEVHEGPMGGLLGFLHQAIFMILKLFGL